MTVLPLDETAPETMTAYIMAASMRSAIEWVRMDGEPSVACHNLLTTLNEVRYSVYADDPTVMVLTEATERALSITNRSTESFDVEVAFGFLSEALISTRLDADSIRPPRCENCGDIFNDEDNCDTCGLAR